MACSEAAVALCSKEAMLRSPTLRSILEPVRGLMLYRMDGIRSEWKVLICIQIH
ncbi:hypothetical protein Plhal304r1_c047g0128511 [Plasmopara halstedii]